MATNRRISSNASPGADAGVMEYGTSILNVADGVKFDQVTRSSPRVGHHPASPEDNDGIGKRQSKQRKRNNSSKSPVPTGNRKVIRKKSVDISNSSKKSRANLSKAELLKWRLYKDGHYFYQCPYCGKRGKVAWGWNRDACKNHLLGKTGNNYQYPCAAWSDGLEKADYEKGFMPQRFMIFQRCDDDGIMGPWKKSPWTLRDCERGAVPVSATEDMRQPTRKWYSVDPRVPGNSAFPSGSSVLSSSSIPSSSAATKKRKRPDTVSSFVSQLTRSVANSEEKRSTSKYSLRSKKNIDSHLDDTSFKRPSPVAHSPVKRRLRIKPVDSDTTTPVTGLVDADDNGQVVLPCSASDTSISLDPAQISAFIQNSLSPVATFPFECHLSNLPGSECASRSVGLAQSAAGIVGTTARGCEQDERLEDGHIIEDKPGNKTWRTGSAVRQGCFADVYLVSDMTTGSVADGAAKYVLKLNRVDDVSRNEEAFYRAVAKPESIATFRRERSIKSVGIMEYISSGVVEVRGKNLRWLILPRLDRSVQQILDERHGMLSRKCVILLALQLLDTLEYIHNQGYAHADLKATNLMTGLSPADALQVYLIDFGMVKRFMDDNKHISYAEKPDAPLAGTLELTSCDAHKRAVPSRRGDMQILGFNLVKWLTGALPWSRCEDAAVVHNLKIGFIASQDDFFRVTFPTSAPVEIMNFFRSIQSLKYDEEPKYAELRGFFQTAAQDADAVEGELFSTAATAYGSMNSSVSNASCDSEEPVRVSTDTPLLEDAATRIDHEPHHTGVFDDQILVAEYRTAVLRFLKTGKQSPYSAFYQRVPTMSPEEILQKFSSEQPSIMTRELLELICKPRLIDDIGKRSVENEGLLNEGLLKQKLDGLSKEKTCVQCQTDIEPSHDTVDRRDLEQKIAACEEQIETLRKESGEFRTARDHAQEQLEEAKRDRLKVDAESQHRITLLEQELASKTSKQQQTSGEAASLRALCSVHDEQLRKASQERDQSAAEVTRLSKLLQTTKQERDQMTDAMQKLQSQVDELRSEREMDRRRTQELEQKGSRTTQSFPSPMWKFYQKKTFVRWANEQLKKVQLCVNDLEKDFSDGHRLIALLKVISGRSLPQHTEKAVIRSKKLANIRLALAFLEEEGVDLGVIDCSDILDGRPDQILVLMWNLISHYSLSKPNWEGDADSEGQEKKRTPKQRLLTWINKKVPNLSISNFSSDWADGMVFDALVNAMKADLCEDWQNWAPSDAEHSATVAMTLAEKWFGVPQLLSPEDMINPHTDDQSMMTYLAQFPNAEQRAPEMNISIVQ
ncbi:uncharacterized protein LOC129590475 [Paramacrobiotus metropolitanus]|uniref:uncharacterized protein LOC129590475 n=1 Tax=Paramacrobiotus metropolitanus TaxID=2943436 RepID=UPI002445BA1C|nr:uncharacterized protein LOC129590475 [Paramacrobiotus metropolitanus]